jgi:hypothetical protein
MCGMLEGICSLTIGLPCVVSIIRSLSSLGLSFIQKFRSNEQEHRIANVKVMCNLLSYTRCRKVKEPKVTNVMEQGAAQKLTAMTLPPFIEPVQSLQGHVIENCPEPSEISHIFTSYFVRHILILSS